MTYIIIKDSSENQLMFDVTKALNEGCSYHSKQSNGFHLAEV
jgi:hypothetical protein